MPSEPPPPTPEPEPEPEPEFEPEPEPKPQPNLEMAQPPEPNLEMAPPHAVPQPETSDEGMPWEKYRTVLLAACIGNVLEWYDFAVYGGFANELGRKCSRSLCVFFREPEEAAVQSSSSRRARWSCRPWRWRRSPPRALRT